MEELKIAVWIFSGVTILTCLLFMFLIKRWEYRHPQAFTENATQDEKLKYKKLVLSAMSTILLYIMVFILIISFMAYGTPPFAIWLVSGLGICYVASTFISILRKK